jgi:phosphoribosylaminoimidazole carboxylase
LHLYDKGKAAPGRKMGHVTVTAPTLEEALRRAEGLFATLSA